MTKIFKLKEKERLVLRFKEKDDIVCTWRGGSEESIRDVCKNDKLILTFTEDGSRYKWVTDEGSLPVTKLDKELSFPSCDKLVMPFLIVPLLTTCSTTDANVEWLAEELANSNCNGARVFSFVCREKNTIQNNLWPFLMDEHNVYDLYTRNPQYIEQVRRRKAYFEDRRLATVITIFDRGSWSNKPKTHWGANPHNGKNNKNNTSILHESLGHFYEHWEEQTPQGHRALATGTAFENMVAWFIEEFDTPYTVWEIINEGRYGSKYHDLWGTVLRECGVPKRRRLTSCLHKGFYKNEKLYQYFTCSIHQINSIQSYADSIQYMPRNIPWLPSGDGPPPITKDVAYPLVSKILKDGNIGYEGNDRPIFHEGDWTFRSLNWAAAREMGRALVDYVLGSGEFLARVMRG